MGIEPTRRTMARTFDAQECNTRQDFARRDPRPLTGGIHHLRTPDGVHSTLCIGSGRAALCPHGTLTIQALTVRALLAIRDSVRHGKASCIPCCSENNAVVLVDMSSYVRIFDADPSQGLFVFVRFGPERTVDGTETKEF